MESFNLSGLTASQRALVDKAISRCRYDFTRCLPALRAQWGKAAIDVTFSDLSRFSAGARAAGDGHTHEHVHGPDGVKGHPIEVRHRVLGLFWFNGKIELDLSLESQPELAQEIFLSEAAHAVDILVLNGDQRRRIWASLHPEPQTEAHNQEHGWFETPFAQWSGRAE